MENSDDESSSAAGIEARGAPRKRLAIGAVLNPDRGKRIKTTLRDLSLTGFSASMLFPYPVDTRCSLTLPGRAPMAARVVWAKGGLIGCAFDRPIAQVTYDAILEQWQASQGSV